MARILVVDDDPFMRDSLIDSLGEAGHRVQGVESGHAGLDAISENAFEMVITDLKMPGMSGLEFLRKVLEHDPSIPVLLVTANGTVETAVEAMRVGAFDYILKPFGAEELRLLVSKSLEHRRLVGENAVLRRELSTLR